MLLILVKNVFFTIIEFISVEENFDIMDVQ